MRAGRCLHPQPDSPKTAFSFPLCQAWPSLISHVASRTGGRICENQLSLMSCLMVLVFPCCIIVCEEVFLKLVRMILRRHVISAPCCHHSERLGGSIKGSCRKSPSVCQNTDVQYFSWLRTCWMFQTVDNMYADSRWYKAAGRMQVVNAPKLLSFSGLFRFVPFDTGLCLFIILGSGFIFVCTYNCNTHSDWQPGHSLPTQPVTAGSQMPSRIKLAPALNSHCCSHL